MFNFTQKNLTPSEVSYHATFWKLTSKGTWNFELGTKTSMCLPLIHLLMWTTQPVHIFVHLFDAFFHQERQESSLHSSRSFALAHQGRPLEQNTAAILRLWMGKLHEFKVLDIFPPSSTAGIFFSMPARLWFLRNRFAFFYNQAVTWKQECIPSQTNRNEKRKWNISGIRHPCVVPILV